MSGYRPSAYYTQGIVLTWENRGRDVVRGLLFQNLRLPVMQWPGFLCRLPAVRGLLAQVPSVAQYPACYGVCMSSCSGLCPTKQLWWRLRQGVQHQSLWRGAPRSPSPSLLSPLGQGLAGCGF